MHYFSHHIKDFIAATRGLSLIQQGAYRALRDQYLLDEHPLTDDLDELCRVCGALTAVERRTVAEMRARFFIKQDASPRPVWTHADLEDLIDAGGKLPNNFKRAQAGKDGARARWDGKPDGKPDGKAMHPTRAQPMTHDPAPMTHDPDSGETTKTTTREGLSPTTNPASSVEAAPDGEHLGQPPKASAAQKKETVGAAEAWLESEPAVRFLCPVFGMNKDITPAPLVVAAACRTWAMGVPQSQLTLIEAFYASAPDFRNRSSWNQLHEDDPRRLRKFKMDTLIDDWAQQLAHAERWDQQRNAGTLPKLNAAATMPRHDAGGSPKKGPLGAHPLERLPDFDWEAVAKEIAPQMGWSEAEVEHLAELNWRDLAPEHRRAILERRQQKKRTSHE